MKTSESTFHKCLYFSSQALARKVEKLAVECWKPAGLSPSHGYLLQLVLDHPGMQPTEVSAQLQLTPSTITRLVEKLESKKLVVRITEGKTTSIYPTPQAKKMVPVMQHCVTAFYTKYSTLLQDENAQLLVTQLGKAADKLSS